MNFFKKFFIKINLTFSFILIFILFSIVITGFILTYIQIDKLTSFAVGMDIIKEIKISQYLAILNNEPMEFKVEEGKIKIFYTKQKIYYLEKEPIFKNVSVEPEGFNFLINPDANFLLKVNNDKIYLRSIFKFFYILKFKSKPYYILDLDSDGKIKIIKN